MGKTSEKRAARRVRWNLGKEERAQRKERKVNSLLVLGEVQKRAAEEGITLRVSVIDGGKKGRRRGQSETYHWMFEGGWQGRERLLDYWPATGRWWSQRTARKGVALDPWDALEVAKGFVP